MVELHGYRVGALLGEGAFGRVHAAVDAEATPVAIKVLTDPASTLSLQREILAIAALDHPHIVRIFDFGSLPDDRLGPKGSPYLVLERCSGGSLSERAPELVSFDEVRSILLKLLDALGHAHARNLIHRDLKLSNVLYATSADLRPGLRLADFGLAGDAEAPDLGGTPLYMPPEQYEKASPHLGPWTDLFALGVAAWKLVADQPWRADRRSELFQLKIRQQFAPFSPRIPVPEGFEAWMKTLMAAQWEERYLSAAAATQGLLELGVAEGEAPTVRARSAVELPTELATDEKHTRWRRTGPEANPAPLAEAPIEPRGASSWTPSPALTQAGRALLMLREPTSIGRQDIQRALWHAFRTGRLDGRPAYSVLTGPEGVGKAHCARWIAHQVHEDAGGLALVLDDALPPPFELVARLLRVRNATLSEVITRLERFDVASSPALQAMEALHLQPQQGWIGHTLALRILGAVARRHPVVLVCLDVDRHPDLAKLAELARTLGEPMHVVVTREEAEGGIAVGGLARPQLARILESWAPLHWASQRDLLDASGGLPGRLVRSVKEARTRSTPDGLEVLAAQRPLDVHQVPPEHRPTAAILGLLGPYVHADALARVAVDLDWPAAVHALVRLGALEPFQQGWICRSTATRATLAALDGPPPRALLNRCSEALVRTGQYAQAVDRALEAGLAEQAVELFYAHCQAGRSLEEIEAFGAALERTALRERVHGKVRRAIVEAAFRTGDPRAAALSADALQAATRLGWHTTAGHIAERRWNYLRAPVEEAIAAFERAPETPDRDWYLSSCWMHLAIEKQDPRAWERALAYAERCGRPERLASTLAMHALKALDDPRAAVVHEERALAGSRGVLQQVSSRMYLQHYLLQAGDWDRVVEVGLEGIAWCELASNRQYLLFILLNTAMARARMGRWSEAEDHASHALALPRYPPSTGIAQLICAVHHAREGNRAPARLLIPELEGLFAQLFDAADPDLFWLLAKLRNALVGDAEALRVQQLIDRHGSTAC